MKYIATTPLFDTATGNDVAPGQIIELDGDRAAVLLDGGHILPEGTPLFFRVDEALIYAYVDDAWRSLGWAIHWSVEALRLPYGVSFPDMAPAAPVETPALVEDEPKKRRSS